MVAGKHRYRYIIINALISTEGQEYVHYSSKIVRHVKSPGVLVSPLSTLGFIRETFIQVKSETDHVYILN